MEGRNHDSNFMAEIALRAKRYDEALQYIAEVAALGDDLSEKSRDILETAYIQEIGARRDVRELLITSRQAILDAKARRKGFLSKMKRAIVGAFRKSKKRRRLLAIDNYLNQINGELSELCSNMLRILETHLIPVASTSEAEVLYMKMKADSHRYLAEISSGEARNNAARVALSAYRVASQTAKTHLQGCHPLRLRVALNLAELHRQFLNAPDEARHVAFTAVVDSYAVFGNAPKSWHDDIKRITDLLEKNIMFYHVQATVAAEMDSRSRTSR